MSGGPLCPLPTVSARGKLGTLPVVDGSAKRAAVKSVSSRGRARLFADALPGSRVIFIIGHPCGQVASMMCGDELLATEQPQSYGLTAERLWSLSPAESLRGTRGVLNAKAIDDLAGLEDLALLEPVGTPKLAAAWSVLVT